MSEVLRAELDRLPSDVREELERYGFDRERFLRLASRVVSGDPIDNRVRGRTGGRKSAGLEHRCATLLHGGDEFLF